MPTARFEADFSSFISAINAAQWAMADMGKGADQVQSKLNDMADKFSGRELIQEASLMTIAVEKIGGVAALTSDELREVGTTANDAVEKLKAMGSDVPAGLQSLADATKANVSATNEWSGALGSLQSVLGTIGVATSVSGFIDFAKSLASGASEIANLSARLQTSTLDIQKFQDIAAATGVPIDTMVNGMQRLSEKIGEGDSGTIAALNRLGISVEQFKSNTAYQDFVQIAAGIDKMGDAETKNAEARALFGNSFKQLTPALKLDIDDIANSTIKMSAGQVAVWDQTSTTWHNAWTDFKNVSAGIIAAYQGIDIAMIDYAAQVKGIPEPKLPQAAPIKAAADGMAELSTATADLNKQLAASQKANDDWLATLGRIDDASVDWVDTLRDMDAQTVKDAEALLKLGVSADDVAERFGLAATQVKTLQNDLAATETYQKAITNIIDATTDWKASLDAIDPVVRREADNELKLGAAVNDVATKYGLASGQVKAMKQEVTDAEAATKKWQDATDRITKSQTDWNAEIAKFSPALKDEIVQLLALGASVQDVATVEGVAVESVKAVAQANKDAIASEAARQKANQDAHDAIMKNGSDIRQNAFYEADAIRTAAASVVGARQEDIDKANEQANQIMADADQRAKAEEEAAARTVKALGDISNARNAGGTFKAGDASEQAAMSAALAEVNNTTLGRMIAQGTQNVDLMNQYQKAIEDAMAARGYSIGGGLTPAAQAVASQPASTSVNTTVNVNGSVLGTSQQVASAVSQAMTQSLKSQGYSLPSS